MNTKLNIEHVYTFIKVVEQGSFTAAADILELSKSVVSKHVSALEDSLQAQLLMRTTRMLKITELGRAFYDQVKNIPYEIAHAQQAIQPQQDEPRGQLNVIAPVNFLASLRIHVIPSFLETYRDVTLNIRGVRPVVDSIDESFDIIILWKLQHVDFPNYNLQSTKLFSMPIEIYATPEYLEEHGAPQTPADLKHHNCFSSLGHLWPFRQPDGDVFSVDVSGNLLTNSDEVVVSSCLNHVGVAYSYPFIFDKAIRRNRVVSLLSNYTNVHIELYAFYHPTAYLPPKIAAFIDVMKVYYQQRQAEILKRH